MSQPTSSLTSPHNKPAAVPWEPEPTDLKNYKHFDRRLSKREIEDLVRDPGKVAKHKFYPLLHFVKKWRRAPKRLPKRAGGQLKKRAAKSRKIRYAARRDAYILKHYREKLSPLYEAKLAEYGLGESVLAYRRIPLVVGSQSNKSNINFAKEAFDAVDAMGKCCAIAIDISEFFESINHQRLKSAWAELFGFDRLPADHFAVFNAVTNYRWVDRDEAFIALGYSQRVGKRVRYKLKPKEIPTQICTPAVFREKILGGELINKHDKPYGIPQGTPISDLLANLFLLPFDVRMQQYVDQRGGRYFRYSDDILILLPGDGRTASGAVAKAVFEIGQVGKELKINANKTEIVCFTPGSKFRCYSLKLLDDDGTKRVRMSENEGLSYLGFRYDGAEVYLRNSTISNLRGKVARTCKVVARRHVRANLAMSLEWLVQTSPVEQVKQKFLRVKDFDEAVETAIDDGKSPFAVMTFWSYAARARAVFGSKGAPIRRQLRRTEKLIRECLERNVRECFAAKYPTANLTVLTSAQPAST